MRKRNVRKDGTGFIHKSSRFTPMAPGHTLHNASIRLCFKDDRHVCCRFSRTLKTVVKWRSKKREF